MDGLCGQFRSDVDAALESFSLPLAQGPSVHEDPVPALPWRSGEPSCEFPGTAPKLKIAQFRVVRAVHLGDLVYQL